MTKIAKLSMLFAALCLPAPAQNTASAKAFVQKVYADYANPDQRHQQGRQDKFYTPQLYRLILADRKGHPGEVGKLDWDPICDCQDPGDPGELKVQSIVLRASDQEHIQAAVTFTIVKEPRKVTLFLLKTVSGWRIDDISSNGIPSLRKFLRGQ